jgi:hypothetical protein
MDVCVRVTGGYGSGHGYGATARYKEEHTQATVETRVYFQAKQAVKAHLVQSWEAQIQGRKQTKMRPTVPEHVTLDAKSIAHQLEHLRH